MSTRKTCKKCGIEKELEHFGNAKANKDGHRGVCKICVAEYYKGYCLENSEKVTSYNERYRKENSEKAAAYHKKYQKANQEKISKYKREWMKSKRNTDPAFRLLCNLRRRLNKAIIGAVKSTTTMQLIGCTIEELQEFLEEQFEDGMTWENYGEWHVDHIVPCVAFDMTKDEEIRKCFNHKNLQPLWAEENLKKSSKLHYKSDAIEKAVG